MKAKRIVAVAFSVALLVALLCSPAHAASTSKVRTPTMRTGTIWSGKSAGQVYNLSIGINDVYASDVDTSFYNTGIGLSDYFMPTTDRTAQVSVMDHDPNESEDDGLFGRMCGFGITNGKYRPISYGTRVFFNHGVIENDGCLELYLLIQIDPISGDQSTLVAAELFEYNFKTTS